MRIVIVNTLYSPNRIGGAEKSVQSLAEEFLALGNEVLVICLDKKNAEYSVNGVQVRSLKIENVYWPFNLQNKSSLQKILWHKKDANNNAYDNDFTAIFNEVQPHVLFTNNLSGFSTCVWSVAKKLNIPIVHTLRDYYLQCIKSTKFKSSKSCNSLCLECKLLTKLKKTNSHNVDYVVGISKYILKNHTSQGYFNNTPSSVIYNGFQFNINQKNTQKTKKDTMVFGFLGQLQPSKGIEFLLENLQNFKNKNWILKIAGEGEKKYQEKLKTNYKINNVLFLGYQEKSTFFSEIDLLIVPSLWQEPFGRIIIEAMMNQVPVLTASKGGIPEIMKDNSWFLFQPNKNNFTEKISDILKDNSILSNFKFNKKFLETMSLNNTAKKYVEVFKKVLKSNS